MVVKFGGAESQTQTTTLFNSIASYLDSAPSRKLEFTYTLLSRARLRNRRLAESSWTFQFAMVNYEPPETTPGLITTTSTTTVAVSTTTTTDPTTTSNPATTSSATTEVPNFVLMTTEATTSSTIDSAASLTGSEDVDAADTTVLIVVIIIVVLVLVGVAVVIVVVLKKKKNAGKVKIAPMRTTNPNTNADLVGDTSGPEDGGPQAGTAKDPATARVAPAPVSTTGQGAGGRSGSKPGGTADKATVSADRQLEAKQRFKERRAEHVMKKKTRRRRKDKAIDVSDASTTAGPIVRVERESRSIRF